MLLFFLLKQNIKDKCNPKKILSNWKEKLGILVPMLFANIFVCSTVVGYSKLKNIKCTSNNGNI